MTRKVLIAALPILILLAIPFLLRPRGTQADPASGEADKLVMITAHNESIRYEYEQAFRKYYRKRFGRDVTIDFRSPGGTSDIVRYIADRFEAEFRREFEANPANGEWTAETAEAFANPAVDRDPAASPAAKRARKLFLKSDTGIGIDLMAGGGTFDMARNAARGFAVDGGLRQRHPEYFDPAVIPQSFGGDELYDKQGRYYGVVLSTFGICYNSDRVRELGDGAPPKRWADLGEPRFYNTLSLADPSKSGSVNKCFEILIQQCMADANDPVAGWENGLNLTKRIFANARNLTDAAGKIPHDVATGNAAAGVAIDTYGFTEQEWNELQFDGKPHFFYVPPEGGTAISADPIQLLRGAPNRKVAEAFLDFVLSKEGQLLHSLKPGAPDGPLKHALRRPTIRRDLYGTEYREHRTDPGYNPYESGANFVYRAQWTGPYYSLLRILIKCIALEPQAELQRAWRAILDAGGPEKVPEAMAAFNRLPFSYRDIDEANRLIRKGKDRTAVDVAATCRAWSEGARANYLEAERLAKQGR
ncbi:extracellular solute-binding protein [uncultured Victivallis sp.]|uniref:extracellular solute-binding protein n=1 Tax=uncultured Victivallis sp. TaxID=354118 RepID=UPI002597BF3A|nr:extracellular solute-binding protein [uncultured Victivallis sp.]